MSADDDLLAPLRAVPAAGLTALRARLADAADAAGALDVAYSTMESPVGLLLLAATPTGIVRIAFADGATGVRAELSDLAARLGPRILRSDARLAPLVAHRSTIAAIALVGNPGGSSGYRIIAGFLVGFTALGTLPAGADGLLRWILTFAIGWFASFLTLALGAMLLAGRQD